MAAARERKDNSYDDGGGFGKFRKRPFRRAHATPYDRPSSAIRNPSLASNSNNNNGWLSKLVDPAQRLITSSAHKLFASVFRKRLPPPPPQPPEPEANGGALDRPLEAVPKDPPGTRRSTTDVIHNSGSSSDGSGLTELELILKQKTFTRSEIDQLTSLLQSRTVDLPVGNQEKKSEMIFSKGLSSLDRNEEFPITPVKDNGLENHHISNPIVLDEDVASPAELAKAYMGSRPSKISPSALGLRIQAAGEDSVLQIDRPLPSKSPIMSVVPRSAGRITSIENGFVTPRSRGRSAIYSMARTPYSRVHLSSTLQGPGTEINVLGTQSLSSQNIWGSNRISGSKQGALKRRSSVLDNDVGSVGPIRRIRQKSNLLPSSATLSIRGNGIGSDLARLPSSSQTPILESKPTMVKGDNNIHGSGFTSVPSKSSEMASKILRQLDMLVSSGEKSPTKLSPSMLRGPALRSLENIDSSKFLETVQDNNKLDSNHDASLPDSRDSMSQKQDKVEEPKLIAPDDKSASTVNVLDPTKLVKNNASDTKAISLSVMNSLPQPPPQKKRAFRMSAHEDYLDLDDDDHSAMTGSGTLAHVREKLDDTLAENKISPAEAVTSEKPVAFSQPKPQESSILNQKTSETSDGFAVAGKSSGFSVPPASLPSSVAVQQAALDKQPSLMSDKTSLPNELSVAPPILSFGDKVSPKEPNGLPNAIFSSETAEVPSSALSSASPVVSVSTGLNFGTSSNSKSGSASSFTFTAVDGMKSVPNEHEPDKADNRNNLKAGVFSSTETVSSTVSTSLPATSIFSFGMATNASNLNGALAAFSQSSSSTGPALVSKNVAGQTSSGSSVDAAINSNTNATSVTTASANNNSSSSFSISASAPSFVSGTGFKFSSPAILSASTSSKSETTGVESSETKKQETSIGNSVRAPFGSLSPAIASTGGSPFSGASSAIMSTGSGIFDGTSSAVTSTASSIFHGTSSAIGSTTSSNLGSSSSAVTSTGTGIFNFGAGASTSAAANQSQGFNPFIAASSQASGAVTVSATSTQSMPFQFGSAASPFGLTTNTAFSSGSSLISSSAFSSGAFGLTSSTSTEANSVSSSSSSSMSTIFGSSWQTPKTPSFSSASSSTGFAFGVSSASNASTSTTSMMFGSSANASSGTNTIFSFSSPAATTSQTGFGNTNPAFAFAPSPSGNNDQMSMEDSMAEDTVQATTSTLNAFSQQPTTTPSSFIFGSMPQANQFTSTTPSGVNQFGSAAQSGATPFQFGASQNTLPAPANVEYNGGSFSLGSNGGDKSNRKFYKVSRKSRKK
ncbi:hypothetical protein JCGZ_19334 [Jatropha curcas]|uniref:Nuclear pore complex protein NUP1 n=1 Tax=Jatropha curcas TaxID=180498 RepID=A0A067KB49_JATCU|nr:nuclear pore complex protein NUP1 isoform X2 [Jatropha curcas]KDP29495.1 hypothetical protein JCGZ_19334 [Jatropha curcas]